MHQPLCALGFWLVAEGLLCAFLSVLYTEYDNRFTLFVPFILGLGCAVVGALCMLTSMLT